MINITNNEESKNIDNILINEYKIAEIILIENAANAILNSLDLDKYESFIIACGPGNNGADGLALARLLNMKNKEVKLICPYNKTIHYDICKNLNIEFIEKVEYTDIIIDALFGTGINDEIKSPYKEIIEDINNNRHKAKLISIDLITEGLDNVDEVLMLSSYKENMLYMDVKNRVLNIGVNKKYYKKASNKYIVDEDFIKSITKKISIFASKKDFGRNTIVAKKGAALLATRASIRCGAGYTTLLSDAVTLDKNLIINNEALNKEINYEIEEKVIAIGPNIGLEDENIEFIEKNLEKDLIIDADMITVLSKHKEYIPLLNENTILTPHYVEFCRLTGDSLDSLVSNPFEALKRFKTHFKGVVVLKGKNNIIYDGNNFYVVNLGNSKMAKAGMGDTLLGMISSYKAQGYSSLNASIIATYKQAKVGKELSEKHESISASMIIDNL
ncbi:bifunctional ADP-dependent NAD(P)H-hydrate dehydratase/NAD(P)H-hydrate epimerase [Oceanivirga miroungae]|uniref:Bifunctional NAD(P)H-hydrate repair enzyme n=1 Tax=Oceanivirga miroungae TaxID=1130046 RepID=A0A6I8M7P9_9FUSO|nr:bifunctional ADP-dependent NAD(P)H-hydrate dehydratase/NAD(P)H-hydrate epimerase [Oceanivirga miroungae]VWL85509.1 carbohydrate kinase [Oceanivirga miroungae]